MCVVPLLPFVYQEYFQDVLQSPFSLILMHQQLLEFLLFLIATFFLPQSEDLYILIVFQIYLFISIGNIKSISFHVFYLWSFKATSDLFAGIALSIWIGKSHKIVALSVSTTFCAYVRTSSYHMVHYSIDIFSSKYIVPPYHQCCKYILFICQSPWTEK